MLVLTMEQTDWSHTDYFGYLLRVYDIPPTFLPVESNLINGKNRYNCSYETQNRTCVSNAPLSTFNFQPGKRHLLRLINIGGSGNQAFSIDNHELTVVSNDWTQMIPYKIKTAILGIGQRMDVIVTGTGKSTDAVWMRSEVDARCANATVYNPEALATVFYPHADRKKEPISKPYKWESENCTNVV